MADCKKIPPGSARPLQTRLGEASLFWRHPALEDVFFFRARFLNHAYTRHTHARYAVGAVESGTQTYACRGAQHRAGPGTLLLINPDEPHDGRTAPGDWCCYRMLYIGAGQVRRAQAEAGERGNAGPGALPLFAQPATDDAETARALLALHAASEVRALPALELESRFLALLARLARRHAGAPASRKTSPHSRSVRLAQEYLRANLDRDPSLADLARVTGLARSPLLRSFVREIGMPPHQFLTQMRLREAQRLLRLGEPAASVAAAIGFVDQSHFIKRFRSAYGMTPRQFAAGVA